MIKKKLKKRVLFGCQLKYSHFGAKIQIGIQLILVLKNHTKKSLLKLRLNYLLVDQTNVEKYYDTQQQMN